MSEIRTQFVRNLKRLMYDNGKTQSDIVSDLGFKQSTVCDWMAGRSYPRPEKMQKLADYLHVPMTVLTGVPSKVDPQLSTETAQLVIAYDAASDEIKEAICRILGIVRPYKDMSGGDLK